MRRGRAAPNEHRRSAQEPARPRNSGVCVRARKRCLLLLLLFYRYLAAGALVYRKEREDVCARRLVPRSFSAGNRLSADRIVSVCAAKWPWNFEFLSLFSRDVLSKGVIMQILIKNSVLKSRGNIEKCI